MPALFAFALPLRPMSVARFYAELMAGLADLAIEVRIPVAPAENATGTPLDQDEEHATYDPEQAQLMWRGFTVAEHALNAFRRDAASGGWTPVRLFWGSLDLATSRFTEEPATEQTAGWWPTSAALGPAFYAYTKPEPPGYRTARLSRAGGFDPGLGEFILTWDDATGNVDPDATARTFFEETARAGNPGGRNPA